MCGAYSWTLPKPVVAAIHGHCIGSGVEIAMLCDLRIAGHDARFSMPEVALGLVPAAGGTQTLPRTVGVPAASGPAADSPRGRCCRGIGPGNGWQGRILSVACCKRRKSWHTGLLQVDQRCACRPPRRRWCGVAIWALEAALELESRLALSAMGSPGS